MASSKPVKRYEYDATLPPVRSRAPHTVTPWLPQNFHKPTNFLFPAKILKSPGSKLNAIVESVDALERNLLLAGRAPDDHRRVPSARREQELALRVVFDAGDRGVTRWRRQDVDAVRRRPRYNAQWVDSPEDGWHGGSKIDSGNRKVTS